MGKIIAIVGAGVSGLLACKYTLSKGFRPIVFESQSCLGGVWTKTFESTKLQTPKSLYQFSDFPWPSSVTEEFPTHYQVLDYAESYAHHFDLLKRIKFNAKVVGIEFEGAASDEEMLAWSLWNGNGIPFGSQGKWKIVAEDMQKETIQLSDVPNMPEFPRNKGPEAFHGKVIHSMDYAAMGYETAAGFVRKKQVTVVGLGKSALDIAMECPAEIGVKNPCRILYRTEHWNLPDYFPWGSPLPFLYLNRFSELLLHKPGEGILLSLLATMLPPLRWVFSKFVESYIKKKHPLAKYGMVPKHSFLQEISSCQTSTVPGKFYDKVEEGSIVLKKFQTFRFCEKCILVDDEVAPLKTDLVILATGFKGDRKLKNIFVSKTFQDCIADTPNETLQLYHEIIHPRIPQLAIIGFSEGISNLYISEIRCRWLTELPDGTFKVPAIKEMERNMAKWDGYMKRYSGKYFRRACIAIIHIWYNDQLCKDMGWNPKRKKGLFAELFEPYGPMDYVTSLTCD